MTKRPQNVLRLSCERWNFAIPEHVWIGATVEDRAHLWRMDALRDVNARKRFLSIEPLLEDLGQIDLKGIHWVIVGGESGHLARPMRPEWVRSIREQCAQQGVPFFFKQWGEWASVAEVGFGGREHQPSVAIPGGELIRVGKKSAGRLLDGVEWSQFPEARP